MCIFDMSGRWESRLIERSYLPYGSRASPRSCSPLKSLSVFTAAPTLHELFQSHFNFSCSRISSLELNREQLKIGSRPGDPGNVLFRRQTRAALDNTILKHHASLLELANECFDHYVLAAHEVRRHEKLG